MKKILEYIGVRLYAIKYIEEYRNRVGIGLLAIIEAVLFVLCIRETVIY